jgi:hypothetical protein
MKSSGKSRELLEEAGRLLEALEEIRALICVNKSLSYAENQLEIVECIKIRAKIFFAVGKYENCLGNLRRISEICDFNGGKFGNCDEFEDMEDQCLKKMKKNHEKSLTTLDCLPKIHHETQENSENSMKILQPPPNFFQLPPAKPTKSFDHRLPQTSNQRTVRQAHRDNQKLEIRRHCHH